MICATVKAGTECLFMSAKGCGYNGGSCHPITEQCDGCAKTAEYSGGLYCLIYPDPAAKWSYGRCPSATHNKEDIKVVEQKINPIKASKRAKGK